MDRGKGRGTGRRGQGQGQGQGHRQEGGRKAGEVPQGLQGRGWQGVSVAGPPFSSAEEGQEEGVRAGGPGGRSEHLKKEPRPRYRAPEALL